MLRAHEGVDIMTAKGSPFSPLAMAGDPIILGPGLLLPGDRPWRGMGN